MAQWAVIARPAQSRSGLEVQPSPERLQQSSSQPPVSLRQLEGPLGGPRRHSWIVGQQLGRVMFPKVMDGCPVPQLISGKGPCSPFRGTRQSQRLSRCLCPALCGAEYLFKTRDGSCTVCRPWVVTPQSQRKG